MSGEPLIALLGAGASRRFGPDDKLSAPCAGKPLGRWALEAALACPAQIVWIYGAQKPDYLDPACRAVRCDNWAQGMGQSIACAAEIAQDEGASALLVLPADMPFVTSALLNELLAGAAPAACRYPDGSVGVPAMFAPDQFAALIDASGTDGTAPRAAGAGAGVVLRAAPALRILPVAAGLLSDVDTPEDLAAAEARLGTAHRA